MDLGSLEDQLKERCARLEALLGADEDDQDG
jgi:hypothetical protein